MIGSEPQPPVSAKHGIFRGCSCLRREGTRTGPSVGAAVPLSSQPMVLASSMPLAYSWSKPADVVATTLTSAPASVIANVSSV
jgi:hypothetical protein